MQCHVFQDKKAMGRAAAARAAACIRQAVADYGESTIILATGASQFEMLEELVEEDVDWTRVTAFHLDEYIGLDASHPASFRKYMRERVADRVPLRHFEYVRGDAPDAVAECRRLGDLLRGARVDLACIGIGENGHLAFNDPPCDFETGEPYLVVNLNEACRRQQVGEGWFDSLEEVPRQAISMSIRQIMKARDIVCTVPDERKGAALRDAVEGPVTNDVPASILQRHEACHIFADAPAASLLQSVG